MNTASFDVVLDIFLSIVNDSSSKLNVPFTMPQVTRLELQVVAKSITATLDYPHMPKHDGEL